MIEGVKVGSLTQWLKQQGAEIRALTNMWEVLRFKLDGVVHVVYRNAKGRYTYDQKVAEMARKCRAGVDLPSKKKPEFSNGWARGIVRHGHGLKALLLKATTGPQHVADCGCDALPWDDCEHTAVCG